MEVVEERKNKQLLCNAFHEKRNAKFISFGDWTVPAYFTSIIDEHQCVRTKAGLFDVSHMGEIVFSGKGARHAVNSIISNDCDNYCYGTAFYALLCNDEGGIVDDVFVYPESQDKYFLIVNATNSEKDYAWICNNSICDDIKISNYSEQRSLFALQGPLSDAIISKIFNFDSHTIAFHKFIYKNFHGHTIVLSASGYTGERGFELVFDNNIAEALWNEIMTIGEPLGLQPIGFGARDTLRIEAGCGLYGHEMSDTINAFESNLDWVVKLEKSVQFPGKKALTHIKENGVTKKLFGLEMIDRAVPREGYEVLIKDMCIGSITSGAYIATTKKNVAIALLEKKDIACGVTVAVMIRGKKYKAAVVELPFYKRKK